MTSLLDILLEADKEPDAEEVTNYSEETVEPEDVDDSPTDYTESEDDETDDSKENDGVEEDTPEDEEGDGEDPTSEPTDYTDEGGEDEASDNTSSETDDSSSEEPDEEGLSQQHSLLEDFIDLFTLVKSIYDKTLRVNLMDMEGNRIIVQVSGILSRLKDEMYSYLTMNYRKNTYIKNLYKFNQSAQTLNVVLGIIKNAKEIKLPDKKKRPVKR